MQEQGREADLTLTQHGSLFSGHYANIGVINQGNIVNVYTSQTEVLEKSQSLETLEVLKQLDLLPYQDSKDTNPERIDGTCIWFTSHPLFDTWLSGPPSTLWAFAYPGCGKSVLARYLVDKVLPNTETRTTCYFFFQGNSESHRSLSSAMCSILRQLFEQRPELLSQEILAEFRARSTITQSFRSLWDLFVRAASHSDSGEIICIIDAVNECNRDGEAEFIAALHGLYYSDPNLQPLNLRFFLTSRPHGYSQRHFQPFGKDVLHIDLSVDNQVTIDQISREIDLVIENKLESLRREMNLSFEDAKHLKDALSRIPNRTRLGVHLVFEDIKGNARGASWQGLRSVVPIRVNTVYAKVLNRLHDHERTHKAFPTGCSI